MNTNDLPRASVGGMLVGLLLLTVVIACGLYGFRGAMIYLAHDSGLVSTAAALALSLLLGFTGWGMFDESSKGSPPWA